MLTALVAIGVASVLVWSAGRQRERALLRLVQDGIEVDAIVTLSRFETMSPSGWLLRYEFSVPTSGGSRRFHGEWQGPRELIDRFPAGSGVRVRYDPADPRNSTALIDLLENPWTRETVARLGAAGSLHALDQKHGSPGPRFTMQEWSAAQRSR